MIDNSASIRYNERRGVNNWQLILNFVKSSIEAFVIGSHATRVAVIDFGELTTETNTILNCKLVRFRHKGIIG